MNRNELNIAIHAANSEYGGVYDVLGSFTQGLLDSFSQLGVSSAATCDYINAQKKFDIAIGFNVSGYNIWESIMNNNICNIMWTVDSIFAQNFQVINQYQNNKKFVVFTVWKNDIVLAREFFPNLQIFYLPHATNPKLWESTELDENKDLEIILTSSVCDYEKKFNEFLDVIPQKARHTAKEIYEILLNNPQIQFYDVYNEFCNRNKPTYSSQYYSALYNMYLPVIESALKVKIVKKLKNFPLKIFGNETWTKYISGKQEYMGKCNVKDSVEIIKRAKICLHPHFGIFGGGLHERFLNAAIARTFVLSSSDLTIKNNFGDSFGYFDFENIADKTSYYLQNDDVRNSMQNEAYEIVKNNHCWINRATKILKLYNI